MPVKRRHAKNRPHRVTDDALAAYRAGDVVALYFALGLGPWQISPLEVDDGPCPYPPGTGGADSWPLARQLRDELRAAVGR